MVPGPLPSAAASSASKPRSASAKARPSVQHDHLRLRPQRLQGVGIAAQVVGAIERAIDERERGSESLCLRTESARGDRREK
jgi:hypothetical protein